MSKTELIEDEQMVSDYAQGHDAFSELRPHKSVPSKLVTTWQNPPESPFSKGGDLKLPAPKKGSLSLLQREIERDFRAFRRNLA